MSQLLDFLRAHEEAFRSRARLTSLYSDFSYQRQTNPDGYHANVSIWLRGLSAAVKAGVIPSQTGGGASRDHVILRVGEELAAALEAPECGRPLALGTVIDEALAKKDLIPLKEYLGAQQSVYKKRWLPSAWDVVDWSLRQIGVVGGTSKAARGEFVVLGNLEAIAKSVEVAVSSSATNNVSRVFSQEMFISMATTAAGVSDLSPADVTALTHFMTRDRPIMSTSSETGTVKFKADNETTPTSVTQEDNTIASLRSLIISLETSTTELTDRIAQLDKAARQAVAQRNTIAAKTSLRRKKAAETKLQQQVATLAQIEEVYAKIEQATDQVQIVQVMEASSRTLRSLNKQTGGAERVQDVVDGLKEEMMNADEIQQTLNEASAGAVDEADVEDEFEALEKVERAKREAAERMERKKREEAARVERENLEAEQAEQTRQRLASLEDTPNETKINDTPALQAELEQKRGQQQEASMT